MLRLPFEPASVPSARRRLKTELAAAGVDPQTVADAALVLSELASNALRHGTATHSGDFAVGWHASGGTVTISVIDDGNGGRVAPRPLTEDHEAGRGLALVERLSESWTTDDRAGMRVTAHLRCSDEPAVRRTPPS